MADTSARLGEARLGDAVFADVGDYIPGESLTGQAVSGIGVVGASDYPDLTADRFTWEGHCWERVIDPDLATALVDGNGDPVAQEQFAARLANILRLNVQNLYVTDEAVINEAVIGRLWTDLFTANKVTADQIAANSITARELSAASVTAPKIVASQELWAKIGVFAKVTTDMLIAGNATITNDLIATGITGNKITAGSITGDKIAAGTITGDKIQANSIAAEKIIGGSFEGKQFIGGDFIGAIFRTSDTSIGGAIRIDKPFGIRGWDKDGKRTFMLDPDTGQVNISANLIALNEQNRGVIIVPTTAAGGGGLWFTDSGRADGVSAAIWRSAYDSNVEEPVNIRGANGGHVRLIGGAQISGGGLVSEAAISSDVSINAGHGFVSYTGVRMDSPGEVSGSANVFISSGGYLRRITSSARYKRNIVDWHPDPAAVLKLRPRQWQHDDTGNNVEELDERWHVGFVAEEVADLGLTDLVEYEGDGRGGWRPNALRYDRFAAAHQGVLVDHEARITQLEAALASLTEGHTTDGS